MPVSEKPLVAEVFVAAKKPVDCHKRTIQKGDEVVIHRNERLYAGHVDNIKTKTKAQIVHVYKKQEQHYAWQPLLQHAVKALPEGFEEGWVKVVSEYFSFSVKCPGVKWGSGKEGDIFTTPDTSRLVVTGRK